jgi:ATP-binding cassette, subfamily F, member 3
LSKYTGTVVFVSHDRYFIDKLATRVFEIGNGRVEVYPGNYEDFLWRRQGGAEKLQEEVSASAQRREPSNGNSGRDAGREDGNSGTPAAVGEKPGKRLNPIKRKQMEERAAELEAKISSIEQRIAQCETSMLSFVSAEETQRLTRELEQHRSELQERVAEWEQIGQELEA